MTELLIAVEEHSSAQPTEQEAKKLLAEYSQACQCWQTTNAMTVEVAGGSKFTRRNVALKCLTCNKEADLRYAISTALRRHTGRVTDQEWRDKTQKAWRKGPWQRLDGRPFLRISPYAERLRKKHQAKNKALEEEEMQRWRIWQQQQQQQQQGE